MIGIFFSNLVHNKRCINGYLKSKIRIFVTHQTHHLANANQILVLNNGQVLAKGTYGEVSKSGLNLKVLLTADNQLEKESIKLKALNSSKMSDIQNSNLSLHSSFFGSLNAIELTSSRYLMNVSDLKIIFKSFQFSSVRFSFRLLVLMSMKKIFYEAQLTVAFFSITLCLVADTSGQLNLGFSRNSYI